MSETNLNTDIDNKYWFVLYTKPRQEFKAAIQLEAYQIEYYMPVITRLSKWSDRHKKIKEPLLKSYIFVKGKESERAAAVELPSIVRSVYYCGRPAKIHDYEIENLKFFVKEGHNYIVQEGLIKGTAVKINNGPFKDVTGIVVNDLNKRGIAVSIELLNRTVIAYFSNQHEIEILKEVI